MALKLYNTLTKRKETFVPREQGKVSMYVCGVTVYDYCHLGHARAYVIFDMVKRYLEYKGYDVLHVQNFTDVDDKIIKKAQKEGRDPLALSRQYIEEYFKDMDCLGIKRAQIYPKVTEHMDDIINMVQGLIDRGYAYEVEGDVYFAIEKFSEYGKLSGRSLEDMKAGARVEVDERKHHPMDFAVWKKAKQGEPAWDSPWGQGRPGWHIECSAMSLKYLGNHFDIHGGGRDLIFPHHENEIAQSEAFTGDAPFVHYWMHNGFVNINEEKMSKSLGNFFTIRDILEQYSPQVLRFFLLSTHYRSPVNFDDQKLEEARKGLSRINNAMGELESRVAGRTIDSCLDASQLVESEKALYDKIQQTKQDFEVAMDDDFNTALGIGNLFELVRESNAFLHGQTGELSSGALFVLHEVLETFKEIGLVFGILGEQNEQQDSGMVEKLMDLILDIRQDARQKKDWAVADKVRDTLKEAGVVIEDTPQGSRWKIE